MSWSGDWNLEYIGKNNKKFINIAKLIITNFKKRFQISDGENELESLKRLSWYSADIDIEKILSYLDDGDQIHVLIDGETHPIREVISEGGYVTKEGTPNEDNYDWVETNSTGKKIYHFNEEYIEPEYDYCEWEDQLYKKENGKVTMECEFTDCDRYTSNEYEMKTSFIYELAYPEQARKENLEGGFTCTLDTYIEWIAREIGDDEEMLPIIQDFMNEIMNISRDEVIEEYGKIDEEAFAYFNDIKSKFQSIESTKKYISEIREKLPPKEKEEKLVLPKLFANMSKKDINSLGGIEQLIKLYEKEGEEKTKWLISILGYDLNSGLKEEYKEQSSVGNKKEENEVNKNIKQAVVDYFLGCVKHKYPNLTEENEKIFSKSLKRSIDQKLKGGSWNCNFSIDYEPCEELLLAFDSMDMSNFNSGLPIYDVFPSKTTVFMESEKCATVSGDYGKSRILYMTDEYKQEKLTSVNMRIMREESKISQDVKDSFEQEYQTEMEAINLKRKPLLKKQEEIQIILDQRKALEEKAQQLIESYSSRVSELNSQGLSDSEKEQRKQEIIKEIKQTQEALKSNKFRERLGKIEEKYGWEDLKEFDKEYEANFDKEKWLRNRYIRYAKQENDKAWKECRKKQKPGEFSWPDKSSIPSELDRLYAEKDEIIEYDRQQKEKTKNQNTSEEQQKFVEALGRAYAKYMKEKGDIDEYSFRNNRESILAEGFTKYFTDNYQNLTNSAFLVEFENGPMIDIAEKRGFSRRHDMFGWNISTEIAHVKVSEGLIYSVDGILDKVKVEYGTPQAIQEQINKLNSEIQFMQDAGEDSWVIRRLESQIDSFVSYQNQIKGIPVEEPTLEELDEKKKILEALDRKTTELLQQQNNKVNKQEINDDGIGIDD